MTTKSVLALIPAYNESARVADVVTGARTHLDVLVVDDGSTDDSAVHAENAGAKVLCQHPNQGKGAALCAGFAYALEAGYQAVVTLDADGQHDPGEIPKFLDAYARTNANLIIGQRDFSQMPPIRRLANTLGQWSFSLALGQHVPDNQSGYRLIDQQMMGAMLASREEGLGGFEFEVDMIVTCTVQGLELEWVPIQTIYAGEASHINAYDHTVNFVRLLWRTRARIVQDRRRYKNENKPTRSV
jgi:glycosyltransferase involved in cell wall biosynthesis